MQSGLMQSGLEAWHHMVKAKDASKLDALLADDVTFHSPVVHTPQIGKAIAKKYLAAALTVLNTDDFKYLAECSQGNMSVLEFETKIDGVTVNGVDIITWSADGQKITKFKVMVRPLKAVNAIHAAMGRTLAQM